MKKPFVAVSVRLCLLCTFVGAAFSLAAEKPATPLGPEAMLRNFYQWYVGEVLANRDPLSGNRKELMRYVSTRLVREIDGMVKGPDGLNGDTFSTRRISTKIGRKTSPSPRQC